MYHNIRSTARRVCTLARALSRSRTAPRASIVSANKEGPASLPGYLIDGGDIVYRDYVDISIAVSAPKGLVTPVLRGVQDMSFADIEKNIVHLGTKAKTGSRTVGERDNYTDEAALEDLDNLNYVRCSAACEDEKRQLYEAAAIPPPPPHRARRRRRLGGGSTSRQAKPLSLGSTSGRVNKP